MPNFWKIINSVINEADVLLIVLDARYIEKTRNKEVELKIKKAQKPLVYAITKCDLVEKALLEKIKLRPSTYVSAIEFYGTTKLRERILIEAKRAHGKQKSYTIGVLGYPNVGKSSLINAMKGKKSAKASNNSGQTRALQKIRADNSLVFLDTPGVIPYKEDDQQKHALIGAIDFNKTKDPDLIVYNIMQEYPRYIESFYQIKEIEDKEETLEQIAIKKHMLKAKNQPDIEKMSRIILKHWQKGDIQKYMKDKQEAQKVETAIFQPHKTISKTQPN